MKELADVILPLALGTAYTYRVPAELSEQIQKGTLVIVPLGRNKYYTGIVIRKHSEELPTEIELKDILEVSTMPPLLSMQLDLWLWLAEYYMCLPGEVMKAALPTGLKVESETTIECAVDFDDWETLTPRERAVVSALPVGKVMTIAQVQREVGGGNLLSVVKRLLERNVVRTDTQLVRQYKPRYERMLRLSANFRTNDALEKFFEKLSKIPRQTEVLTTFLEACQAPSALQLENDKLFVDVSKQTFMRNPICTPAVVRALIQKGVIEEYDREVERLGMQVTVLPEALRHQLNEQQKRAIVQIQQQFAEKDVCLLHGVTSSGKTEVYIHLIEEVLKKGEQVLFLVPEIALTTQITKRLGRVFGDKMGVYHSKFPDNERVELWQRQLSSNPFPLILGVRSSIFLPFQKLGLIIIDEEHEGSYKQQDPSPRYHARDSALVLARLYGAKTLLGTATPSLETYAHTQSGKYGRVEMFERFGGKQLPEIIVEDVKELKRKKLYKAPFTERLVTEMRNALKNHEQIILFQNRRGYSPILECNTCGWTPKCDFCDVPLTVHKKLSKLVCHYCGKSYNFPKQCPACEEHDFYDKGFGTERIESAVHRYFPEAKAIRMDLDSTQSRNAYDAIINEFSQGKTDILVGTQMVTKGLDFDHVRVVGIIDADQMFNAPDFRAEERAFQMLSQVAGRAGRKGKRGVVILQTRKADHPVVGEIVRADFQSMFSRLMEERKTFLYPPFCRIIHLTVRHRDAKVCTMAAEVFAYELRKVFGSCLNGPYQPVISRIKLYYIRELMLKITADRSLSQVRRMIYLIRDRLMSQSAFKSVRLSFNVDPV